MIGYLEKNKVGKGIPCCLEIQEIRSNQHPRDEKKRRKTGRLRFWKAGGLSLLRRKEINCVKCYWQIKEDEHWEVTTGFSNTDVTGDPEKKFWVSDESTNLNEVNSRDNGKIIGDKADNSFEEFCKKGAG